MGDDSRQFYQHNIKPKHYIISLIVIATVMLLYCYNPLEAKFFPRCPFLMLTGFQCPGCGSQRALHSLLHFNIKQAWAYNPLLLCAIPYLLVCVWLLWFPKKTPAMHRWRKRLMGEIACYGILLLLLLFTIVRNCI